MKNHDKMLLLNKGKAVSFWDYCQQRYGHVTGFVQIEDDGYFRTGVAIVCDDATFIRLPEDIDIYEEN